MAILPPVATYAFIDGNYLHTNFKGLMAAFYDVVPAIDYQRLAATLDATRFFFYDAIDYSRSDGETDADYERRVADLEALHDHINSCPGFHVRDGHVRRSRRRGREQKGVDVQLAVDAMEHAARGNMQAAVLLAGDLDFEPLVNSLVRLGVRTRLVYVPQHTSKTLMRAADDIRKLTLQHFHAFAGASFQRDHAAIQVRYGERFGNDPELQTAREGSWGGRRVRLFHRSPGGNPLLHVEQQDELREQSYTVEYPDAAKLQAAFELSFGGSIEWR